MNDAQTAEQVRAELADLSDTMEAAGIYVALEVRDGALILSGEVDSVEMHEAALDLAQPFSDRYELSIEDAIDVLEMRPDTGSGAFDTARGDGFPGEAETITDVGTVDAGQSMDEAIPYFPPTDPVIGSQMARQDEVEVIGGFQTTSMHGDEDTALRQPFRGDEQITEDVLRELREDATTTDLKVRVHTRNGVVFLVGEVPTMEDAENAEAVAGRVTGVDEVREELKVASIRADRGR